MDFEDIKYILEQLGVDIEEDTSEEEYQKAKEKLKEKLLAMVKGDNNG